MAVLKGDQFGTFLERVKHYRSEQAASVSGPEQAAGSDSAAETGANKNSDKILLLLLFSGPQAVPELMKLAGMGAFEFFKSLNPLIDSELVVLKDVAGEETASLTENGEKVANLAKQAG